MDSSPEAFAAATSGLAGLGDHIVGVLRDLLRQRGIAVQDVPCRVKDKQSADKKALANPDKYPEYSDLKDLLGLRVITLFESDLVEAEQTIREVLDVSDVMVTDKVDNYRPNEFGYRSKHFVGPMTAARLNLPENKKYRGRVVEVQLRSILQHAWAEIEHDLGYKPQRPVTFELRRRFSQLAALMELADASFSDLRSQLESVEAKDLVESKENTPPGSPQLTAAAIGAFIRESAELQLLDTKIAVLLGTFMLPESENARSFNAYLLDICLSAGWESVDEVARAVDLALTNYDPDAVRDVFGEQVLSALKIEGGFRPGFSLVAVWKLYEREADDGDDAIG